MRTWRTLVYSILAVIVTVALSRMALKDLQFYGLIVAIPVAIYCARMVYTLEREES